MRLSEVWLQLLQNVLNHGELTSDPTGDYLELQMLGFRASEFDPNNPTIIQHVREADIVEMRKVFLGGGPSAFAHDYWHQIGGTGQLEMAVNELRKKASSRKAVVVLGIDDSRSTVPCVNALHFILRNNSLDLHYFSRGQDLWLKFVPDVLALRDLQRMAADMLGHGSTLGSICGAISSAHIYKRDLEAVRRLIER